MPDIGYSLIMLVAIVAGVGISHWLHDPVTLRPRQRAAIALAAFCGAMIAAKLPFVLSDYQALLSGAAWFSNGKTIMFGLVGGYAGVEIIKWILRIRVKTGDGFAVPVAVAVGIGRLACFHAGCCFGTPTTLPWGCEFDTAGDSLHRHPTQLYEALFHLCAAGVLLLLLRKGKLPGQLIKLYIISYMTYRFFTEWIRPEPGYWLGLTFYQWSALAFIPVFLMLWKYDSRKIDAPARPSPAPY